MELNERIRHLRNELDMKQEDFGKKINLTKFAISNYENGRTGIPERVLNDICREFNVNEVWLRAGEGGDENMFTKVSDDDRYSINLGKLTLSENEFIQNAINALAETDPEKLKIVEEFIKKCLGIK